MKFTKIIVFLLLAILFFAYNSIGQNIKEDKIIKIKFFYLPWNLRPPGSLSEINVRNYNNKSSTFEITDSLIINEFELSLQIYKFREFEEMDVIDGRMVIDLYFDSGKIDTLLLNTSRCIKYKDNYFYTNFDLKNVIDKYVPLATW